jgi:hypothetical protein
MSHEFMSVCKQILVGTFAQLVPVNSAYQSKKNASVLDTFNHTRTRQGWKRGGGMAGLGLYRKTQRKRKEYSKICVHIFTACELTIHVAAIPLKLSSVYSIFEISQV